MRDDGGHLQHPVLWEEDCMLSTLNCTGASLSLYGNVDYMTIHMYYAFHCSLCVCNQDAVAVSSELFTPDHKSSLKQTAVPDGHLTSL